MKPRIVLDVMGGDLGPGPAVEGALQAVKNLDVEVILVGRIEDIEPELPDGVDAAEGLRIVDAREVILMHDNPTEAVRGKPDSSMNVGMLLLKAGEADAFVTAGNTGGAMTAALLKLGRIRGISRPALATVFPAPAGRTIILDVGANADARAIHLIQFAHMGSAYMKRMYKVESPRVGLISNGEEEGKGNALTLEVYDVLRQGNLNFTGNVEGNGLMTFAVDVAITDGFTGNVLMKTAEGIGAMIYGEVERAARQKLWTKLAGLMLKSELKKTRRRLDHGETGGAQLLGTKGNVIIGHGSSNARSTFSSIRAARDDVRSGLLEVMHQVAEEVPARPRKGIAETVAD